MNMVGFDAPTPFSLTSTRSPRNTAPGRRDHRDSHRAPPTCDDRQDRRATRSLLEIALQDTHEAGETARRGEPAITWRSGDIQVRGSDRGDPESRSPPRSCAL